MSQELSEAGKEQLAFALLLLKDFKTQDVNGIDLEVYKMIHGLAVHVGVLPEFEKLLSKVPPMSIKIKEYP